MPVPTLVIANAAYTQYPGGVIALRAINWLGAARGTLSTEADARAISGQAVRDTQTVTNSILSAGAAAFAEADDTLSIDLSALPLLLDMTYTLLVSFLIEGDWDPTNTDTLSGGTQEEFAAACQLGFYGDSFNPAEANWEAINFKPRGVENYRISGFGGWPDVGDVAGNETLHIRAYAQAGTTVEWLLDQVFLIPYVATGFTQAGEWEDIDFKIVDGYATAVNSSVFAMADLTGAGGDFVDGNDGGDDNGTFTWQPFAVDEYTGSQDGGGDYQKKASAAAAEYYARVYPDDGYYLWNSQTVAETTAYCYALSGAKFIPTTTWIEDLFSRTTGPGDWGDTPEGFGWGITGLAANFPIRQYYTDGDEAHLYSARTFLTDIDSLAIKLNGSGSTARPELDNAVVSGSLRFDGYDGQAGPLTEPVEVSFTINLTRQTAGETYAYLFFDVSDKTWALYTAGATEPLIGPVDISAWWAHGVNAADGTQVGFKVDLRRYRVRVKVWDDGGAEPGTWDADEFRGIDPTGGDPAADYDYDADPSYTWSENDRFTIEIEMQVSQPQHGLYDLTFDHLTIEHEPTGTGGDTFISMEQPEATVIGEITVPHDAWHLSYWGARDWTGLDSFGDPAIEISAKTWSETGSAELQRAELLWWYFRSIHHPYLIPMNWRSSTREGGWKRVLKGNS